jgi:hypothetical protein
MKLRTYIECLLIELAAIALGLTVIFATFADAGELNQNLDKMKAQVSVEIEKLRADREAALKPARQNLLKSLESESKQWQAAGKLDLVLAYDARKAELESALNPASSPLAGMKAEYLSEHPIAGSKSEDAYKAAQKQIYAGFTGRLAKLDAIVKSLDGYQKQLVQAGKKDDALTVSDFQVALNDEVQEVKLDFSTELIAYDRWYKRDGVDDFVRFKRGGSCNQTFGPNCKGESDYTYKISGNVITMTRGPSRPQPLVLKVVNVREFEEWKLVSDSELARVRGR